MSREVPVSGAGLGLVGWFAPGAADDAFEELVGERVGWIAELVSATRAPDRLVRGDPPARLARSLDRRHASVYRRRPYRPGQAAAVCGDQRYGARVVPILAGAAFPAQLSSVGDGSAFAAQPMHWHCWPLASARSPRPTAPPKGLGDSNAKGGLSAGGSKAPSPASRRGVHAVLCGIGARVTYWPVGVRASL
jgi:hypothetical protein